METHWNVLVLTPSKWILVLHQREKTLLLRTLGSWYIGLSVYRASALKISVVTEEQPNLSLAFVVLGKVMISGSDTSRASYRNTSWGAEQMKQADSTSLWGWLLLCWHYRGWLVVWYRCGFTPPLCCSPPSCGCKHGTPVLQLFLQAWSSSVEASVDCRTCLRSWLSPQAINQGGVCSKAVPSVWATQLRAGRHPFVELPCQSCGWVSGEGVEEVVNAEVAQEGCRLSRF